MKDAALMHAPALSAVATRSPSRARGWCWLAGWLAPLALVPLAYALAGSSLPESMRVLSGLVLILTLATCAATDFRWRKIYNWATYPAVLWLLAINAYASLTTPQAGLGAFQFAPAWFVEPRWLGAVGIAQSLSGLTICFGVLLLAFQLARGGAGDVKLATVIGAALGMRQGVLAVAVSYIVAGGVMLCWSIWQRGPLTVLESFARRLGTFLFPVWVQPPHAAQQLLLQTPVPLAPFFAIGTLLVMGEVLL
jgi:Flp pilus assembly protein protease CpaA